MEHKNGGGHFAPHYLMNLYLFQHSHGQAQTVRKYANIAHDMHTDGKHDTDDVFRAALGPAKLQLMQS